VIFGFEAGCSQRRGFKLCGMVGKGSRLVGKDLMPVVVFIVGGTGWLVLVSAGVLVCKRSVGLQ